MATPPIGPDPFELEPENHDDATLEVGGALQSPRDNMSAEVRVEILTNVADVKTTFTAPARAVALVAGGLYMTLICVAWIFAGWVPGLALMAFALILVILHRTQK